MNRTALSRRLLQVSVAISSADALLGGALYLSRGVAGLSVFTPVPLPISSTDPTWSVVDYMFRALAGIWFALGLMLAYVAPSIEKHSAWFSLICVAIFGMGIGRALSLLQFAPAPGSSLFAMVAELVLPPLLVLWQRSVARACARASGSM
ncbi:MAG TPA: DUF4345 domain-containing protein [Myxococcota bacterium]|jgi:hypothetical protein|nr:DUF4345 domain-containing protein [Myxococcota bacterium]